MTQDNKMETEKTKRYKAINILRMMRERSRKKLQNFSINHYVDLGLMRRK